VDQKLVESLNIDKTSKQPPCHACIEAKQMVQLFSSEVKRDIKSRELMHIDVWGKYSVISIKGHQYYIVLVDNATRYVTVEFMKYKNEASQKVKNYLSYLQTQGKQLRSMHMD
jgi:hypothetical protein